MDDALAATRRFYGSHGETYDRLARSGLVRPYRRILCDAVDLGPGDTVVDVGTGTGANVPHLRPRVGTEGRVIGVDVTPGLLEIAVGRRGGAVAFLQADATDLPVCEADAVVGSFVAGMVEDGASMVDAWVDVVGDGGRVALLDAAPRTGHGGPLDEVARAAFRLGATPGAGSRHGRPPETVLAERVGLAHDRLRERTGGRTEEYLGGFVRVTSGRV
ncbi:MAG: class I SAM-dependent methyltransferase [Halanaeroarchaeum sp.]